jgi:hypothetical protein
MKLDLPLEFRVLEGRLALLKPDPAWLEAERADESRSSALD